MEFKERGYSDTGMRDANGVLIDANLYLGRTGPTVRPPKPQEKSTEHRNEALHRLARARGEIMPSGKPPSTPR